MWDTPPTWIATATGWFDKLIDLNEKAMRRTAKPTALPSQHQLVTLACKTSSLKMESRRFPKSSFPVAFIPSIALYSRRWLFQEKQCHAGFVVLPKHSLLGIFKKRKTALQKIVKSLFRRWDFHHPWCSHLCRSPTEPMREVTLKQSVKVNPGGSKLAIERVISHKSFDWKRIVGIFYFISTIPWHFFFHGCFLDFQGELYSLLSSSLHPYAWQTEVKTLAMTIWKVVLSLSCFPCLSHSGSQSRKQFHTPPVTTYTSDRLSKNFSYVFSELWYNSNSFLPLLL